MHTHELHIHMCMHKFSHTHFSTNKSALDLSSDNCRFWECYVVRIFVREKRKHKGDHAYTF